MLLPKDFFTYYALLQLQYHGISPQDFITGVMAMMLRIPC